MRNLDIADSRARLEHYAAAGIIGGAAGELVGRVTAGESDEITERAVTPDAATEALDDAIEAASESAMYDAGTD
ncbi:hypothetical protein [Microbacterium sp. SSM24]|uniref:hypothetical protein n=1 Tax=Microbacterium sp. SSM24 TaxID=2991714 RepID=UPI0022280A08|nr:hypothetical protein [Microbacterium sp. SSM24]MCW3492918.1 hypothetical protein [Microbacterium sp. SSM24]